MFQSLSARTFALVLCFAFLACPPPAQAVPVEAPKPNLSSVTELIEQLKAPRFKVRQQAKRELIQRGRDAIPLLQKTAQTSNAEVAQRAVAILKKIHRSEDVPTVDEAELALAALADSEDALISQNANDALKKNYKITQDRAMEEIKKLGGSIAYIDPNREDLFLRSLQPDASEAYMRLPQGKRLEYVILGADYTGGDAGLIHVKRLKYLPIAFIIDGSGVSDRGKEELQTALPYLKLENRQQAFLGVTMTADFEGLGCRIMTVKQNSAAAKAKLAVGDIIHTFDGHKTPDPTTLIDLIGKYKPGQKIEVQIYRFRRLTPVTVTLGAWR